MPETLSCVNHNENNCTPLMQSMISRCISALDLLCTFDETQYMVSWSLVLMKILFLWIACFKTWAQETFFLNRCNMLYYILCFTMCCATLWWFDRISACAWQFLPLPASHCCAQHCGTLRMCISKSYKCMPCQNLKLNRVGLCGYSILPYHLIDTDMIVMLRLPFKKNLHRCVGLQLYGIKLFW